MPSELIARMADAIAGTKVDPRKRAGEAEAVAVLQIVVERLRTRSEAFRASGLLVCANVYEDVADELAEHVPLGYRLKAVAVKPDAQECLKCGFPMPARKGYAGFTACPRCGQPAGQEPSAPAAEKRRIVSEASYLLSVLSPSSCPSWVEGKGDCGKRECTFCRAQKCIDELDNLEVSDDEVGQPSAGHGDGVDYLYCRDCGESFPAKTPPLTFARFQKANAERCVEFKLTTGEWSLLEWAGAAAGEMGEVANVCKKLKRKEQGVGGKWAKKDPDEASLRAHLAEEIGDVLAYLALLAEAAGLNLGMCAAEKFDRVSDKIEWKGERLVPAALDGRDR